jgi:hypothetical protein
MNFFVDENVCQFSLPNAVLNTCPVRSTIMGHLAWVMQHATGNRGDDIRALKLAELQPWTMLHPNGQTGIDAVLGLQSEEKAGKRGMRTVSVFFKLLHQSFERLLRQLILCIQFLLHTGTLLCVPSVHSHCTYTIFMMLLD